MGALLLAEAAFFEGKYPQKIPMYGGSRRGGDGTVFLRLDDRPIRRSCGIYSPDALVVLDPAQKALTSVRRGLKKGGLVVLNDDKDPEQIDFGVELQKVATVDATGISTDIFGSRAIPITNTIMLGAIAKATDWVKLESLYDPIKHMFQGRIEELNLEACRRGYESVKIFEG